MTQEIILDIKPFTLLFAIFAIIPKTAYPKLPHSNEIDRKSPWFNPLFFGHFAHIDIDEYKKDYAEKLLTDDKIYDTMVGDIYGQGKKEYKNGRDYVLIYLNSKTLVIELITTT